MILMMVWLKQVYSFLFLKDRNHLIYFISPLAAIKHCPLFSTRNVPTILPPSGIQRTPHLFHHGFQTAQSNPGHASLSALAHHPHREELVSITFCFVINHLVFLVSYFFYPQGKFKRNVYDCRFKLDIWHVSVFHKMVSIIFKVHFIAVFNRFHYAARIWDGVKKSSALSEYSRLLC